MTLIATFYAHFGAVRYVKACKSLGVPAKLMPVPRDLSSSCGTCVRYESDKEAVIADAYDEIEQIVEVREDGYREVFRAKDS